MSNHDPKAAPSSSTPEPAAAPAVVPELAIRTTLTPEEAARIIAEALRSVGVDPEAKPRPPTSPPAFPELARAARAKRTQPPPYDCK